MSSKIQKLKLKRTKSGLREIRKVIVSEYSIGKVEDLKSKPGSIEIKPRSEQERSGNQTKPILKENTPKEKNDYHHDQKRNLAYGHTVAWVIHIGDFLKPKVNLRPITSQ